MELIDRKALIYELGKASEFLNMPCLKVTVGIINAQPTITERTAEPTARAFIEAEMKELQETGGSEFNRGAIWMGKFALECLDKPSKPLPKSCGLCIECMPGVPASFCGIDGTLCADKYVIGGEHPDWCPMDKPPVDPIKRLIDIAESVGPDSCTAWLKKLVDDFMILGGNGTNMEGKE